MTYTIILSLYAFTAIVALIATLLEADGSSIPSFRERIEGLLFALFWPVLFLAILMSVGKGQKPQTGDIVMKADAPVSLKQL